MDNRHSLEHGHVPNITFTEFGSFIIRSTSNHTGLSVLFRKEMSQDSGTYFHQFTLSSTPYPQHQGHSHSPQTHHLADRSANTKPLQTPLSCTFTTVSQTLPCT